MAISLVGEATVTFDDTDELGEKSPRTLDLVMNNAAWMAVESITKVSYLETISELAQCEVSGRAPLLGTVGALLYGATRAKHRSITLDECCDLMKMDDGEIASAIGEAIRGSLRFKATEPGEAKPAKRPARGTGKKP